MVSILLKVLKKGNGEKVFGFRLVAMAGIWWGTSVPSSFTHHLPMTGTETADDSDDP